eukprot:g2029.t1 g2029   contig11:563163-565478(+)
MSSLLNLNNRGIRSGPSNQQRIVPSKLPPGGHGRRNNSSSSGSGSGASFNNGHHGRLITAGQRGNNYSHRTTNGGVVADGAQLQLQRQPQPLQQQQVMQNNNINAMMQHTGGVAMGGQHQNAVSVQRQDGGESVQRQGVDMDEVLKDIQILEDQKQESQRGYESAQLAKNYQLERKAQLDSKLSKIKYQNGAQRAENQRSSKELSIRHRELLDARGRSERSRKNISRFEAKMKRAIGVARLLPAFQNRVEAACIKLNESVTRMNFLKGQAASKSNAAIARRDDAKHRQELLLKSIHNNQQKERSITEEISKVRAEIAGNEADLSSAQQMESQTKLRVETIEHEIEMERNRHVEVMADIEAKNTEIDVAKIKAREIIEERKVMIEAKKEELSKVWTMANAIRISEGQEALPEPKQWGIDHAPFLDVARIRSRVNDEEAELLVKKSERDSLHSEVEELERLIQSNQVDATMKQEEAAALLKNTEESTCCRNPSQGETQEGCGGRRLSVPGGGESSYCLQRHQSYEREAIQ